MESTVANIYGEAETSLAIVLNEKSSFFFLRIASVISVVYKVKKI